MQTHIVNGNIKVNDNNHNACQAFINATNTMIYTGNQTHTHARTHTYTYTYKLNIN